MKWRDILKRGISDGKRIPVLPSFLNVVVLKNRWGKYESFGTCCDLYMQRAKGEVKVASKINYSFMFVSHLRSACHVVQGVEVFRFFAQKLDVFWRFLHS